MSSSDKLRGKPANRVRMNDFWDAVYYCDLIDQGSKGGKYTWLNKRLQDKSKLILEWLDLYLANNEWLQKFPKAQVHHLPRTHSDHCPLLLSLFQNKIKRAHKVFHFESMWTIHSDLNGITQDCWGRHCNIKNGIPDFVNNVTRLNNQTFGNIFH